MGIAGIHTLPGVPQLLATILSDKMVGDHEISARFSRTIDLLATILSGWIFFSSSGQAERDRIWTRPFCQSSFQAFSADPKHIISPKPFCQVPRPSFLPDALISLQDEQKIILGETILSDRTNNLANHRHHFVRSNYQPQKSQKKCREN